MRILHVIQELQRGGAERVLVSLVHGAEARGNPSAVAATPGPLAEELPVTPYPLPLLRRRPERVPYGAWALRRAIRDFRPDLVHAHNPGMAAVAALATLRGRRPPALVTVQGVPEEDYAATSRVLRLAGLPVVGCGPGVSAALEERGVVPIATIGNAVGSAPPPADRAALEREWEVEPGAALVAAVGRLVHQKNHALAIRALARVPRAHLVVLGEGPLQPDLGSEARAAGVADRVTLAGGRADAWAIVAAADAFVMPSHWEGLPLAALEALAAGTPVVATAVRGLRELLVDGESGLLVPPGDEEALAAALRRVLADTALAGRLAEGGREVAEAHTEEAMVGQFLAVYERVAAR
jgi:glycosyltransferase involved in cell wall biosynthesis